MSVAPSTKFTGKNMDIMYIIKIANEILTTAILISMQVRPKMAEKWVEMDFPDHGLI